MQVDRKDADFDHQTVKTSKIHECDHKTCYDKHPKNLDIDTPANFRKKYLYNPKKNNKERTEEHSEEIKRRTEIALLNTELNIKVKKEDVRETHLYLSKMRTYKKEIEGLQKQECHDKKGSKTYIFQLFKEFV